MFSCFKYREGNCVMSRLPGFNSVEYDIYLSNLSYLLSSGWIPLLKSKSSISCSTYKAIIVTLRIMQIRFQTTLSTLWVELKMLILYSINWSNDVNPLLYESIRHGHSADLISRSLVQLADLHSNGLQEPAGFCRIFMSHEQNISYKKCS